MNVHWDAIPQTEEEEKEERCYPEVEDMILGSARSSRCEAEGELGLASTGVLTTLPVCNADSSAEVTRNKRMRQM